MTLTKSNHESHEKFLLQNLSEMRGVFCDVNLKVQDKTIPSHKLILSAVSPFFRNIHFNIVIQDQPDVHCETKKLLAVNVGESIVTKLPICVEVNLQTVEGDKMVLEVWSLNVNSDQTDPTSRAAHAIYNRMGLLLKSLISVTRATPAYKLSRRQCPDSYRISYKIYTGEPQTHNLGEGCKQVRVGQLCTQLGTINMSIAYRTKLTISPTQTGRDNTIMMESNYFPKIDVSPKHPRYPAKLKSDKIIIDLDKPLRPGAFADISKIKQFKEEDYILPETPPFSWLLRKTKETSSQETSTEDEKMTSVQQQPHINNASDEKFSKITAAINLQNNNNSNEPKSLPNNQQITALPVKTANGVVCQDVKDITGTSPGRNSLTDSKGEIRKSSRWTKPIPPEDEKLLKELHFPFATENTMIGDLAKFYRDCYNAPPLRGFEEDITPITDTNNAIDELSQQLEQFETSLQDYDNLVTSLGCPQVDSNSNS